MTNASLEIDFRPQPRAIAVVTSAPITAIANSGRFAALQDLVDGYASAFEKVFVVSPNGDPVAVPSTAHRISWFSGPGWLPATSGLSWTAIANRRQLRNAELVRTFGPQASLLGRMISRYSGAPHVASPDDLVDNQWRFAGGCHGAFTGIAASRGVFKADVLSITHDWEIEYVKETGYEGDVIVGTTGLATDYYTPVRTTDPSRHPVVLCGSSVLVDIDLASNFDGIAGLDPGGVLVMHKHACRAVVCLEITES